MRPRRRQREHHHHQRLGITGSQPGTSQSPSPTMSTPVKHLQTFQRPQHPQPPCSATNHNSGRPNLLDQAELDAYINRPDPASARNPPLDLVETTSPGLTFPSLACSDLIETTDPYREARTAVSKRSGPVQTLPRAALPDVHLEIGAALPEVAATCRIPRAERPPVVLDIPGSTPEPSEPRRHTDSPSRGPKSPR